MSGSDKGLNDPTYFYTQGMEIQITLENLKVLPISSLGCDVSRQAVHFVHSPVINWPNYDVCCLVS